MKIKINLEQQELRGLQAARFEIYDSNDVNQGAFFVGKSGIKWQEPHGQYKVKAKSWSEVIKWLRDHGRSVNI